MQTKTTETTTRKPCPVCGRALRPGRWGAGTGVTMHLKCYQQTKPKGA